MSTTLSKADPKPKRRIKKATVTHVSLCRRAKNRMPVLLKSHGRVQFDCLSKAAEGLLTLLVYVPEENGAVDSDGDVAPADVVKAMAHDFLANGGNIDVEHDLKALSTDKVRIAETFVVQKGDPRFAGWTDYDGKPVNPEGSWGMVLKLLDPEIRKAAESGELNGASLFGQAEVEILKADPTPQPKDEFHMTPEQMTQFAAILAKALKPAESPKPEPVQKAAIPFEGDPSNLDDIAKHEEKLFMAGLDLTKAEDVAKLRKHVEAKKAAEAAAEALKKSNGQPDPNAERIQALEAELAGLRKASSAPAAGAPKSDEVPAATGLKKSEADLFAAGRKLAQTFQGTAAK